MVWYQQAPVRQLLEELEVEAKRILSKHRSQRNKLTAAFALPESALNANVPQSILCCLPKAVSTSVSSPAENRVRASEPSFMKSH